MALMTPKKLLAEHADVHLAMHILLCKHAHAENFIRHVADIRVLLQ